MGVTRTEGYKKKDVKLAELAKAIGHPARVAILRYMIKHPSCICGDIVDELPLSQPTVSQHLKALKQADIISGTIEGTSVCYCLNHKTWQEAQKLFDTLLSSASDNSCC